VIESGQKSLVSLKALPGGGAPQAGLSVRPAIWSAG
jgi:hypothetical protein